MAFQRVLTGVVLFLMAAAGLVLLRPDWFPDVTLPAFLAGAPTTRIAFGVILGGVAALWLAGMALSGRRPPAHGAYPSARPALLDDEPAPVTAHVEQPASEPTDARWAPLPPLRLVDPPEEAAPAPDEAEPAVIEGDFEPAPDDTLPPAPASGEAIILPAPAPLEETPPEPGSDVQDAHDLHEEAVAKARAIHAADPDDQASRIVLAEAIHRQAALEEGEGRLEPALHGYEESLGLYRQAAAAEPEDTQTAQGLVAALGRLAEAREARGHTSRARDLYAEAVTIAERLTWLKPDSDDFKDALFHARRRRQELDNELSPAVSDGA